MVNVMWLGYQRMPHKRATYYHLRGVILLCPQPYSNDSKSFVYVGRSTMLSDPTSHPGLKATYRLRSLANQAEKPH